MQRLSSSVQRIPVFRPSLHSSDTSPSIKSFSKGFRKNWVMSSMLTSNALTLMPWCVSHTWMLVCKKRYESCLLDPLVPCHWIFWLSFWCSILGPPRSSGRSGVLIENNWIAPNTTLHMPVYAMHRDPSNFGLGNRFIPERWLGDTDVRKSADVKLLAFNHDAFVPFSAGYSSCVGKHLALQNIK